MGSQFTNADYGSEARVELHGREVRIIFVASSVAKAEAFADRCLEQMKGGGLNLTLMGKPTSIVEE